MISGCVESNNALKGRFYYMADIQQNVITALSSIPENEFQGCFQKWEVYKMQKETTW